jgi:hypothetical protein
MKERGIKAEENNNTIIIDIGRSEDKTNLTIHYDKIKKIANIHYKFSGEPAKELVRGIGQHFPILERLDNLVENLSYVEVSTRIKNKRKKCNSYEEHCKWASVDIEIVAKPYSIPEQNGTQSQPPTELIVILAQSSLEELIDLAANGNIRVSRPRDTYVYVIQKDKKEPIFGYYPTSGWILHSYTVSGESAKKMLEEVGRYIPLPKCLKKAENIRITLEYTLNGYVIGLDMEI